MLEYAEHDTRRDWNAAVEVILKAITDPKVIFCQGSLFLIQDQNMQV